MKKLLVIPLILIIFLVFLAGCWDTRVMEEVGFILSFGVDVHKDYPNKYIVTQSSPVFVDSAEEPIEVLSVNVTNPIEAIQFFTKVGGRAYRPDHLEVMLLSEEVARQGNFLADFDFVYRNPMFSSLAFLMISEDEVHKVLNTKFPAKDRIAVYLSTLIREAGKDGLTEAITLITFRQQAADSVLGKDPVVPTIRLLENGVNISGLALFQGDKMVGQLSDIESNYYLLMTNKGKPRIYLKQGEAIYGFTPRKVRNEIKPKIDEGKISFEIKTDIELTVEQAQSKLAADFTNLESKKKLEAMAAEHIKGEFLKTIAKMQQLGSDPLGLGKILRAKHYDTFNAIDWHVYYPVVDVKVDVKVTISRHGIIK